jgi:hydrogenase maturation factor HypF (carbamoyltransferase family)
MYFIFEIAFSSSKNYIANLIRAYAVQSEIEVDVLQTTDKIIMIFNKEDEKLEGFLLGLETILPASLFLAQGKHYFSDEKPALMPVDNTPLPLNIAPCPTCQKEMFDVSSRRYYYPFTSCNHCGTQHPFVIKYPYERANTSMKFLVPCEACATEAKNNALRLDYPLISCIECGIAIRMLDKESEHLALNKGDFRKLFEVSGRAIASGKKVLMKTAHGYRKFFKATEAYRPEESILLMTDSNGFNDHLMMVTQEFNALLSIERPLLRVATKSDEMKAMYGSSVLAKYPDDGMTMLLARELMNAGLQYISYIPCESDEEADFLVDFDMPINSQEDTKIYINQDTKLFISGERILFPAVVQNEKNRVTVAHDLACVKIEGESIIDTLDVFDEVETEELYVLEGESIDGEHSNEHHFEQYKASMMSVLAEYHKVGEKAIGVHFDGTLNFLYYNGKTVINAVPAIPFESDHLWEKIRTLREGSDRLVDNYKKSYPEVWERLNTLEGNMDIFEVTAITLGLEDESFEGISAEALSFLGKGGLQIDTRVKDNRFDNYAFLTSIMSYQLGGVENNFMCYSIYESFGDYIGEIVPQLADKVGTRTVVLTGETFANQSLYGRIQRTIGQYKPLMNKNFPIGKENAVYGALYL